MPLICTTLMPALLDGEPTIPLTRSPELELVGVLFAPISTQFEKSSQCPLLTSVPGASCRTAAMGVSPHLGEPGLGAWLGLPISKAAFA